MSWEAVRREAGASGVRRLIQLATKCPSIDDFIEKFAPFVAADSIAIPTTDDLAVGDTGRFLITLRDRSPVMRGKCEVIEIRPGKRGAGPRDWVARVKLVHLDEASRAVHERLLAVRRLPAMSPAKVVPLTRAGAPDPRGARFDAEATAIPTGAEAPFNPTGGEAPPAPGDAESNEFVHEKSTAGGPVAAPSEVPTRSRASPLATRSLPVPGGRTVTPGPPPVAPRKLTPLPPAVASKPTPLPPALQARAAAPLAAPARRPPPVPRPPPPSPLPVETIENLPANPFGEVRTDALVSFVETHLFEERNGGAGADSGAASASRIPLDLLEAAGATPPPVVEYLATAQGEETPKILGLSRSQAPDFAAPTPPLVEAYQVARATPTPELSAPTFLEGKRRWLVAGAALVIVAGAGAVWRSSGRRTVAPVAQDTPASAKEASAQGVTPPAPPITPSTAEPEVAPVEPKAAPVATAPVAAAVVPKSAAGGPCTATITTRPEGVQVSWAGRPIGRTPLADVTVPCGPARVVLGRERYQTLARSVVVQSGTPWAWDERLVRPMASIAISSTPSGGAIFINGRAAGVTPRTVAASRFETVQVEVKKTGFRPFAVREYVRNPKLHVEARLKARR